MILWQNLTREEIGKLAQEGAVAIIPVGAVEQHGPHLPVITDKLLIETIAESSLKQASQIAPLVPLVLAPCVAFGFSHHHLIYPGALSLSTDTLMKVLYELVECVIQSGFQKIYLLNGHGGNEECVRITARNAALRYPVTVAAASYWTMAWPEMVQFAETNDLYGVIGHAGLFETSMMLAVRPDLVHLDRLSASERSKPVAAPVRPLLEKPRIEKHGSWAAIDGFTDYPQAASPEIGAKLLELISEAVAKQLIHFQANN